MTYTGEEGIDMHPKFRRICERFMSINIDMSLRVEPCFDIVNVMVWF